MDVELGSFDPSLTTKLFLWRRKNNTETCLAVNKARIQKMYKARNQNFAACASTARRIGANVLDAPDAVVRKLLQLIAGTHATDINLSMQCVQHV